MMRSSQLFRRALLAVVGLFGLTIVTTTFFSTYVLKRDLSQEYLSKGAALAKAIAAARLEKHVNNDSPAVQQQIAQALETAGVAYVFVVDEESAVVSHTFPSGFPEELRKLQGNDHAVTSRRLSLGGASDLLDI
ncbi:MAG: sensor domain-containing diguanylate cyclase, partial [Gemmataceae bacterium]